jgi:hypothetical protein
LHPATGVPILGAMPSDPTPSLHGPRGVLLLAVLTLLFAARVTAQLVQRVAPVDWLPAFGAFQGSGLAYPTLLGAQGVILVAMIAIVVRLAAGAWTAPSRVRRTLTVVGWIYFGVMAARLAIGALLDAGAWFEAWIPAVFHLVLATFVLTWATCLRTAPRAPGGSS